MNKTKTYEKEILEIIRKKKIMRFSHVFAHYTGCSMSTAYNHELEKLESIKGELEANRSKATDYMLQKWIASDNPTLQIAAMRLVAPEEDRRRLNQQYHEHEMKGQLVINTDEETKKNIERIRDD